MQTVTIIWYMPFRLIQEGRSIETIREVIDFDMVRCFRTAPFSTLLRLAFGGMCMLGIIVDASMRCVRMLSQH